MVFLLIRVVYNSVEADWEGVVAAGGGKPSGPIGRSCSGGTMLARQVGSVSGREKKVAYASEGLGAAGPAACAASPCQRQALMAPHLSSSSPAAVAAVVQGHVQRPQRRSDEGSGTSSSEAKRDKRRPEVEGLPKPVSGGTKEIRFFDGWH
ncbi:hypothetical protein PR202_ga30857 [Eleusine coracana subsp. coracana]|uniref:Uncharacterized protein n=1 Tax=Eleusine coracana subsp. coracana TaxID=191504 RepID=A0AAV5DQ80_ELECO|nr:hypothetical protein PR202_ga30857 [Eleusine coracana subsp. coracana]